jgi:hypothetical protein
MTELEEVLFNHFHSLGKAEQASKIVLAANAEFVVRMLQRQETDTEVGKVTKAILEALLRRC